MRDGILRRALKRAVLWHGLLNLRLWRALRQARGGRPWSLGGACRRCAACCEAPALVLPPIAGALPLARRWLVAWQRQVNGFELLRTEEEGRLLVFRCTHFDPSTRSCDSYGSRPLMCRDYPRALLWQASPELLPGCGYRASPPNAAGLRAALVRLELSDEQREKLRRGLRLDG